MKHFFVISLPRSRTAWLANFLTNQNAFCHHELMRKVTTLKEYEETMRRKNFAAPNSEDATEFIGDANPTLITVLPEIIAKFPEAKFVFIYRPVEKVLASYQAAFPKVVTTLEAIKKLEKGMLANQEHLVPTGKVLAVKFEDLEKAEVCNQIHQFCLERPMNEERWKLLNEMRVTTMAEKAARTMAPFVKAALAKAVYPLTPANEEWNALMAEMCDPLPGARLWLENLWHLAYTWDHLVDGDPVDLARAENTFEAILLEWPLNPFWKQYSAALIPVLSNALAAWRDGERARDYDVYSEVACAVAFCLGGRDLTKKFSPRIRSCVAKLLAEDNARDNQ